MSISCYGILITNFDVRKFCHPNMNLYIFLKRQIIEQFCASIPSNIVWEYITLLKIFVNINEAYVHDMDISICKTVYFQ